MASVSRKSQGNRTGWRIRFYCDKKLREIYLAVEGKRGETMANKIAVHVENLAQSKTQNVPADPAAIAWANKTDGSLRENLVTWGLAEPLIQRLNDDSGRLLGAFIDSYIGSRSDVKPSTITNYKQTRRLLVEYFGETKTIQSVTVADAERWKRWLLDRMSPASVCKHVKRAKTFFVFAVDDRLLDSSPFIKIKAGDDSNPERQRFIDRNMASRILEACPDSDWRVIFTLSRFGGFRAPSEVLGLKWSDVDWESRRLRIESPKTGLRFCPMFTEVHSVLSEAFDLAPEGAVYVIGRYREGANIRTQFGRIIESAGLVPWPKLFNNLRSSCRTELQDRFPSHVLDEWLGHSTEIAKKHYLQITEDHWRAATESGSHTGSHTGSHIGSHIKGGIGPISTNHQNEKTPENIGKDAFRGFVMSPLVTPTGPEKTSKSRGKTIGSDSVPISVPTSESITDDLRELVECWRSMSPDERSALMAVARGMVANKNPIPKTVHNKHKTRSGHLAP